MQLFYYYLEKLNFISKIEQLSLINCHSEGNYLADGQIVPF